MGQNYSTKQVADTIAKVVSPYVGEAMGQSAGSFFMKRLGITSSELSGEDLESVLAEMSKGLKVFIGQGKAEQVSVEVRDAVEREVRQ
jgi:hypothetical protein